MISARSIRGSFRRNRRCSTSSTAITSRGLQRCVQGFFSVLTPLSTPKKKHAGFTSAFEGVFGGLPPPAPQRKTRGFGTQSDTAVRDEVSRMVTKKRRIARGWLSGHSRSASTLTASKQSRYERMRLLLYTATTSREPFGAG